MTAKGDRLNRRLVINPDEQAAPVPRVESEPVAKPAPEPAPEPVEAAEEQESPGVRTARARARPKPAAIVLATEAADITPGKKDYRSFYVEDSVYARFRAAVYWSARHPDAAGEVPENMSAAAEVWMDQVATSLEKRLNRGEVFRAPPAKTRQKKGK